MIQAQWKRAHYVVAAKHLVLHALEWVILLFYFHRHNYILHLQGPITIGNFTQPATLDNDHIHCVVPEMWQAYTYESM